MSGPRCTEFRYALDTAAYPGYSEITGEAMTRQGRYALQNERWVLTKLFCGTMWH